MGCEDYYSSTELEPALDPMPQMPCDKCKSVQYSDFMIPTNKGLLCESCFDKLSLTEDDIVDD